MTGCVTRWDVAVGQWLPLGSPLEGVINAAVRNASTIYIGGRFTSVGESSAAQGADFEGLARFDGFDWRPLEGGGVSGGDIRAMAVGSENLYVGGSFVRVGNVEVTRVARYDGVMWHKMGQLDGDVQALSTFGEYVFAGGDFVTSSGGANEVSHIARFYAGFWQQLGTGVDGTVYVITPIRDCLYIGGSMSQRVVRTCIGAAGSTVGDDLEAVEFEGAAVSTVRVIVAATHDAPPTQAGTCVVPGAACTHLNG
uniref:Uncharacterized protein n=1 Tax=Hemiselmis andersenii TaxID=464988 RepID=A0A7S1DRV5_HEMAN